MRPGGFLERILCRNGNSQLSGHHGAIEVRKLFDTGDGVVGNDAYPAALRGFGLDSVGIGEPAGMPECIHALLERLTARQCQHCVGALGGANWSGNATLRAPGG